MMERLGVEFEVEKTESKGYGYEEKYLKYRGERIGYKAIVRDGEVLAIVKRGYKLIPHELVLQKLERLSDFVIDSVNTDKTRLYVQLKNPSSGSDIGVLVVNSVDGSLALKCFLTLAFGSARIPIVRMHRNVKRVHKKNAKVDDLSDVVRAVFEGGREVKSYIDKILGLQANDFKDVWETLAKMVPRKYVERYVVALTVKKMTVREIFEGVSSAIYNSDIDMRTKLTWLGVLYDCLWVIAETAGVK